MTASIIQACPIPENDPLFQAYHDEEWGVPEFGEQALFEKVCLEGFQSGLSWRTILHKRMAFRRAFDNFDPGKLRNYSADDVERLMKDKRIVRNRRKILSVINNAYRLSELQAEVGSLAKFVWSYKPQVASRPKRVDIDWLQSHTFTTESIALSNALKRRGWSYIGPTNMYALMQAMGVVNDHVHGCPRQAPIEQLRLAQLGSLNMRDV